MVEKHYDENKSDRYYPNLDISHLNSYNSSSGVTQWIFPVIHCHHYTEIDTTGTIGHSRIINHKILLCFYHGGPRGFYEKKMCGEENISKC